MREAVLARHGESELSLKHVINGDPAAPCSLTEAGREQARRLGELIAADPIELCVTSEFERAKETADIALAGRDVPRLVVPGLNDIEVGEFEGGMLETFRGWISEHGPAAIPPGGGESRAQTALRYAGAFRTLVERPEDVVLVVCHGLPVTFAARCSRGEDPPLFLPQEEYATPHRLSAHELTRAADVLERWARDRLAA
jgi:2,3-bisphosphoglycerate-dependent phosphoglycerate mutase